MKILKYIIPITGCSHSIPESSEFLSCQLQNNEIAVWYLTKLEPEFHELHKFSLHGTGHTVPESITSDKFLTTIQFGPLVLHVFAQHIG